jgi:hypothetical protein
MGCGSALGKGGQDGERGRRKGRGSGIGSRRGLVLVGECEGGGEEVVVESGCGGER